MIRKFLFITALTGICFAYNACERHEPTPSHEESAKQAANEKAQIQGEHPQATDKSAAQFLPAKKTK
ncbi:MAG: hypothetical protein ABIP97_03480 [Chthoniobacterales bacterium]